MRRILFSSGAAVLFVVLLFAATLLWGSLPALRRFGLGFLTGRVWDPVSRTFGVMPFVVGTLVTSFLALLFALPFSLAVAILTGFYLGEGRVREVLVCASDLFAGVPSVVYGFWGLYFLVPLMRRIEVFLGVPPYGVGILTASLVLSLMVAPYICSVSREAISMVPGELVEAGFALGATRWEVVRGVVLPHARSGIAAGVLLALGRALGETMAVTMVVGNSSEIPKSLFQPANTLASVIANEFTEATADIHLSALVGAGLVLMFMVTVVNILGMWVVKRLGGGHGKAC